MKESEKHLEIIIQEIVDEIIHWNDSQGQVSKKETFENISILIGSQSYRYHKEQIEAKIKELETELFKNPQLESGKMYNVGLKKAIKTLKA